MSELKVETNGALSYHKKIEGYMTIELKFNDGKLVHVDEKKSINIAMKPLL